MSGLSKLQKQILGLALRNRESKDGHENSFCDLDVFTPEILEQVYRFPVEERSNFFGTRVSTRKDPTRQHFDLAVIGRARYNAAQAAVSRALRRLEERGLVERQAGAYAAWCGANLTPEGVRTAQRLRQGQVGTVLTVSEATA